MMSGLDLSVPSVVLGCICLCMVKLSATSARPPSNDSVVSPRIGAIVPVGGFALILQNHFQLNNHNFLVMISFMIAAFFPYLSKMSKHRPNFVGAAHRNWNDRLIGTSGTYFLAALFAFVYSQHEMALVCFITSVGSSLYHRHREMMYFNLDHIFATSLMVVFIYTLISSYRHHEVYFTVGAVGLPFGVFLLVYCGMPADINLGPAPSSMLLCCIRQGREMYDSVHNLWHLASGVGPFMAVWYFHHLATIDPESSHYAIHVLPTVSLSISLVLNILGNIVGVMPLE